MNQRNPTGDNAQSENIQSLSNKCKCKMSNRLPVSNLPPHEVVRLVRECVSFLVDRINGENLQRPTASYEYSVIENRRDLIANKLESLEERVSTMEKNSQQDPSNRQPSDRHYQSDEDSHTTIDFEHHPGMIALREERRRREQFLHICGLVYDNVLLKGNELEIIRPVFERYRQQNEQASFEPPIDEQQMQEWDSWEDNEEDGGKPSTILHSKEVDGLSTSSGNVKQKRKRILTPSPTSSEVEEGEVII